MRYLVFSDLHGDFEYAKIIVEKFKSEGCDMLICLGDILYHGPRNDLPKNYNPKEVIKLLNPLASKIIAVRGNCDAEVDQMVLDFKINDDYQLDSYYLCHGHHLNFDGDNNLPKGIILYGHYHIPSVKCVSDRTYINVGSITFPKNNSSHSYAILEDNLLIIKDIYDNEVISYSRLD